MYIHIIVLIVILFFVFNAVWKSELLKSLFFTICFIIVLWINIPCFVSISNIEQGNNLTMIPFNLNAKFGILYTIFSNILLGIILFLQSKFTHKVECSYREIKKVYDDFGNDAVELYIIGKDLDFLYGKNFKKQTDRIEHLKNKCKLLCESTTDENLLKLYRKVSKQGVEIRFCIQNDNITNLKGQIKTDQRGIKKAIFTSRLNKKYLLLSTNNQFLVSAILERCIKVYQKQDVS
ncbi:MAG: hypothetical protein HFJ09_15710 [Lachnospiraceae bacterium]|nr:hypothetical protein [Lachnospiraceae bacterium]